MEHGHAEVEHGHAEKPHAQRVAHTEHGHHEPAKKPKKKKHDISGVSSVGLTSDVPLNPVELVEPSPSSSPSPPPSPQP